MLNAHIFKQILANCTGILGTIIGKDHPRAAETDQYLLMKSLVNGFCGGFKDSPTLHPLGKTVFEYYHITISLSRAR